MFSDGCLLLCECHATFSLVHDVGQCFYSLLFNMYSMFSGFGGLAGWEGGLSWGWGFGRDRCGRVEGGAGYGRVMEEGVVGRGGCCSC